MEGAFIDQVTDFFGGLFDTSLWPPRWHCGHWTSFHGWLYIISDLMVFSAYFAIPLIIVRYMATRTNSRFHKIYFLFASFILACGFTHLIDALTFWYPVYRFNALMRFITGVISWTTVYYLFRLLPVAFSLKTAEELQAEIDQRKLAEEDLKLKIKLLNEAQEIARLGHWQWHVDTGVLTWSDNMYRIYGVEPQTQTPSYELFLQLVHPEEREQVAANISRALQEKKFPDFYHRIITSGGVVRIIHARGEAILNDKGEVTQMMGTGQDITEQKNIEQELLIKSSELETKNAELEKFAYIASHDLQEPLRKIRTFVSRLQDDRESLTDDKARLYMDKVAGASLRMHTLINDILNFSRISFGTDMQFGQVDLDKVLKNVLADMEVLIEQSNVHILCDRLPVVQANATQMSQLFQNILSNAIKFRKAGVPPAITITCEMLTGPQIKAPDYMRAYYKFSGWIESRQWEQEKFHRISFTDNGEGFDKAYAERIFEAFQRLDTAHEGTGIGLAICKKIVEQHHGTISAESTPGNGATFTIILPLSQANFKQSI